MADRFPSPFEIAAPAGAEGWEELYPYSSCSPTSDASTRTRSSGSTTASHWPRSSSRWTPRRRVRDRVASAQYNTRHYLIPPAYGIDFRILNGYVYLSPVAVPEAEIEARVPQFMERAGHYFANWDGCYDELAGEGARRWSSEMSELDFEPLPEMEALEVITAGARARAPATGCWRRYHRLLDLVLTDLAVPLRVPQPRLRRLPRLLRLLQEVFPGIPDQAIAKMVAGRRHRPLPARRRAQEARPAGGRARARRRFDADDVDGPGGELRGRRGGRVDRRSGTRPRTRGSTSPSATASTTHDKFWIEHLEIPLGLHPRLHRQGSSEGEDLTRPVEALHAERDRIVEEYRELLDADEDRAAFDAKLGSPRTVFPYVENHNFYIEHWTHRCFWRKVRELGEVLAEAGFMGRRRRRLHVRRDEVRDVLFDLVTGWAVGAEAARPALLAGGDRAPPGRSSTRSRPGRPPPALNTPPEVVTEPFTSCSGASPPSRCSSGSAGDDGDDGVLSGMAASPGLVEGPARVIIDADQIGEVQDGRDPRRPAHRPVAGARSSARSRRPSPTSAG